MGAQKLGYLPTLDGWRAIAVLMTVLQHEVLLQAGPFSTSWIHAHGRLGVDIFFGISGLLICSRLMDEEGAHGKISLKEFYIRRAFSHRAAHVAVSTRRQSFEPAWLADGLSARVVCGAAVLPQLFDAQ